MYLSNLQEKFEPEEMLENSMLPVKYYLKLKDYQMQQIISECLGILITNSAQVEVPIIRMMENYGISLGNGAFALVQIGFSEPFFPFPMDCSQIPAMGAAERPEQGDVRPLHKMIHERLNGLGRTVFFSHGGNMYALMCLQGELSEEPEHYADFFGQLRHEIKRIKDFSNARNIPVRIRVSNIHLTVKNISRAYKEVSLMEEYSRYMMSSSDVILLWDYRNCDEAVGTHEKLLDTLFPQLAMAIRNGQQDTLMLCIQNLLSFLVGTYPVSEEIIKLRTELFFQNLGNYLLENTVVNALFLQRYQFSELASQCIDLQTLKNTVETFILEAQRCCQQISALMTTELLIQVKQYLEETISDPNLSATSVADHFHVSRTTLSSRFHKFFGTTMTQCILETRIAMAKELLRTRRDLTVNEIAMRCGFCAVSTMYRVFMRLENCSPGIYRAKE